jgi:hypothetical protein
MAFALHISREITYGYVKDGLHCDSFLPGYKPAYADFESAYGRAVARLKVIESARQRKDLAWKDIETSDCDGAAMWLKLGLTC